MIGGTHRGPPVRLFLVVAVLVVLGDGLFEILVGRGPVLVVLPWVEVTAESFAILAALSIAYFCLGRYRVLGEPPTLWVGLAFWANAIFTVLYLLTVRGVVDSTSVLAVHPYAGDWQFHYKWTALALLLVVAALARWPERERGHDRRLFAAVGLLCLLVGVGTFLLDGLMPPLV